MTMIEDPDAALMLRVKEGDREAFEVLVERYQQKVLNLIYHLVRDQDEAEDLAQQVFVQVYRSAGRYRISAKFSTWLYTIGRNLALNELRRRRRHPAASLDETWPDGETHPARQVADARAYTPGDALIRAELYEKVEAALAALPEKQRTAIVLCREGDVSYEEIAEVLGCTVPATKSLIHRGREALKLALKPYLSTGEWKTG